MLTTLIEQLEILRRIGERGLKQAQEDNTSGIDCWQHLLDEIQRTQQLIIFSSENEWTV